MSFNKQQADAIAYRGGPLMIQAGAGTGKTTTIIGRVVSFLKEGVAPENICMMTFTNKAAHSMQSKIIKQTPLGNNICVGTFHGVALQLLYKTYALVGVRANFKVFGTYETKKLWSRALKRTLTEEVLHICEQNGLHKPQILESLYSRMKSGMMTMDGLFRALPKAELYERYAGDGTLAEIFTAYDELKNENNGVDFNDILGMFYEILQNKTALAYVRRRYTHYFIDEYQDTSVLQAKILHKMLGDNPNVTVVGDPNQSIYAFLSANIHNMLDFTKEYPTAKIIQLNENYRSTDAILGVTNKILDNDEAVYNPLHSGRTEQTRKSPIFHTYGGEREEAAAVVRLVKHWLSKGVPPNEIAILARYSMTPTLIESQLTIAGIPFVKYGGTPFNEKFHIKKFLALVELAMDKNNYLAWEEILPLIPYIGEELTMRVIAEMKRDSLWNWELIPTTGLGNGKRGYAFREVWNMFAPFGELQNGAFDASKLLDIILGVFKNIYTNYVKNLGRNAKMQDDSAEEGGRNPETKEEQLEKHIAEVVSFAEYLKTTRSNDLQVLLGQFRLDSSDRDVADNSDKVVVSTIHSAKGLEWTDVVLLGLEDGLMPPKPKTFGKGKWTAIEKVYAEEEERLFYVAATRAKDELHITTCQYRMGREMLPSPFISKFFPKGISEIIKNKKYEKLDYPTHKLYIKI